MNTLKSCKTHFRFLLVCGLYALVVQIAYAASAVVTSEGGDCSATIQQAINDLPSPRNHSLTVKLVGEFKIDSAIRIPSFTRLDLSEAYLVRVPDSSGNLVENADIENGNQHIEIIGGRLDGGNKGRSVQDQNGILMSRVSHLRIVGVDVRNCGWAGVRLTGLGKHTRHAYLSQLYLEGNGHSGLTVMWASRNTMISDIIAYGNGAYGLYSDHSEGSYTNIQTIGNRGVGFFIRNIFAGNYSNITSALNGREGIRVVGMTDSLGLNWGSHNNSVKDRGVFSNIVFSADDTLSYGRTSNTLISNISADDLRQFGQPTSKQGIEIEGGIDSFNNLQIKAVMDAR